MGFWSGIFIMCDAKRVLTEIARIDPHSLAQEDVKRLKKLRRYANALGGHSLLDDIVRVFDFGVYLQSDSESRECHRITVAEKGEHFNEFVSR